MIKLAVRKVRPEFRKSFSLWTKPFYRNWTLVLSFSYVILLEVLITPNHHPNQMAAKRTNRIKIFQKHCSSNRHISPVYCFKSVACSPRGNYWISWVNCPLKTCIYLPFYLGCGPPPLYHPLSTFLRALFMCHLLQRSLLPMLITLRSLFSLILQSSYCYLTQYLLIGWHSVSSHWTVSSLSDSYTLFTVVSPRPKMRLFFAFIQM